MGINIFQVDSFCDRPFGGNPAGVVPSAEGLTEDIMQVVAKEINASETAFIKRLHDELYKVRFFTPTEEVDLCGHATIGAFFVLASKGYIPAMEEGVKVVHQITKAGTLPVYIEYKKGDVYKVSMEQASPEEYGPVKNLEKLCKSLGLTMDDLGFSWAQLGPEIISTGLKDIILPVKTREILNSIKPDRELLMELSRENDVVGVHAFSMEEATNVIHARNFAPLVGIDEESATGTSNGATIYYLKKNKILEGREMIAYQGESLGRPSQIICSMDGDIIRVGGKARMSIDGILILS